jgi:hypothetical protein
MHRLTLGAILLDLEVGNLQLAHGPNGRGERIVDLGAAPLVLPVPSFGAKGPKNLGAIESLPGAMVTEAHDGVPRSVALKAWR